MKKVLMAMLLLIATTSAFAQFEKGTKYVGASLTGLDLSYSEIKKFNLGLDLKGGYFIEDNWMVLGHAGMDYSNSDLNNFYLGAQGRYYMKENGIYLGAGLKYMHMKKNINDLQITPEVGYCYYISHYVSVEPAVYYDMSLTDFSHKSKVGLKVGIGLYF